MKKIIKKLFKTSVLGIIMAIVFVASYVFASIQLTTNFQVNTNLPLDSRTVVADIPARDAILAGQRYQGLIVYVVSTATNYQLQGGVANSNWTIIAGGGLATNISGGLGGQILYQSAVDTTSKLANGAVGQVLTSNGTTLAPSWETISGATPPITVVNNSNLFSTGLTGTGSGVTAATYSNFFGENAGNAATSASRSNFFGENAGNAASSAFNSNFLGTGAGQSATSASYSNFLGTGAGQSATSAASSNFIGNAAGGSATSASFSNFLGYSAGANATNASNSIFIGKNAGNGDNVNNTGSLNDWSILLGYNTNTGGNKNSILLGGSSSGTAISNTKANQFMLAPAVTEMQLRGIDYTLPSAQALVSGQVLTNDGSGGLTWATSGGGLASNISGGLGGQILYQSAVDTTAKLANGTAGQVLTSAGTTLAPTWTTIASSPITIVNSSNLFSTGLTGTGSGVTTATYSNFFGENAGNAATSVSDSNFLGNSAGYSATSASNSNFLGNSAGWSATSASFSNFLGLSAGSGATSASNSNFLGLYAGQGATSASNSNFLGYYAGSGATSASNSIFIGQKAGYQDTVNNTLNANDWSILLGYNTKTGGFKNSILLGGANSSSPILNTKANQFMLADTITDVRWRGIEYSLPSSQGAISTVLTNDGSGGLSWSTASGTVTYTNANLTPNTVGGIAAGSTFPTPETIQSMLDKLLYPYIAPSVALAAVPSTGVREFGNNVASVTLNATTTKRSNNITLVEFYRGASLIHTQTSPIPGGGLETYVDSTPVTTNGVTFTAKVGDGTQTTTSGGVAYTFVYPFYYGVGAQGLTGAQIRSNLTPLIKTPSNTTTVTSPSSQVFYLAYPNTSPALTSILDTNGFETISDFTLRTVSITGLDSTSQTYKVYEYNNLTTQTNFTNQFKF